MSESVWERFASFPAPIEYTGTHSSRRRCGQSCKRSSIVHQHLLIPPDIVQDDEPRNLQTSTSYTPTSATTAPNFSYLDLAPEQQPPSRKNGTLPPSIMNRRFPIAIDTDSEITPRNDTAGRGCTNQNRGPLFLIAVSILAPIDASRRQASRQSSLSIPPADTLPRDCSARLVCCIVERPRECKSKIDFHPHMTQDDR